MWLLFAPALVGQKQINEPGNNGKRLLLDSLDQLIKLASYNSAKQQRLQQVPTDQDGLRLQTGRQYQHVLEEVCVQRGIIKRNLPASTQLKAAPAIETVRGFWRSHPGDPDVISVVRSEVRRIFGIRPNNIENVLVCYVFGEALQCTLLDQNDIDLVNLLNSLQKQRELIQIFWNLLKMANDTNKTIIRQIK